MYRVSSLLCIKRHKGEVQEESDPVSVYQEEERQESVDGGFGDDVGVQPVAEVDGVDVVTASIAVSAITAKQIPVGNCLGASHPRELEVEACNGR